VSTSGCRACEKGADGWLAAFIDQDFLGLLDNLKLGKPCPYGHRWNSTPYTLRYKTGSKCQQCQLERTGHWYERNKEKHKQRQAERISKRKREGRQQDWLDRTREARRRYKANERRKKGCRLREEMKMSAKLNFKPSPTVADLVLQQQQEYWRDHPHEQKLAKNEALRAKWKLRYLTDPRLRSYTREKSKRRKAQMRGTHLVHLRPSEIKRRFAQFDNRCAYCGADGDLHIEHFIPISKGGPHAIGNIIPACKPCNFAKYNHDPEEWYQAQEFFSSARWALILKVLGKQRAPVHQLPLL
jgi:5-methylcytosine-specific restriction endonuclease McrA